jgi:glycosyltransferase involved in cell wall biosynthesis
MSRKALLISEGYYPGNFPGANRAAKLAKYLPQSGWTPVVLCAAWTPENAGECYDPHLAAQPDVCRTVRVPYPSYPATKIGRGLWIAARLLFPYRAPFSFTRGMLAEAQRLIEGDEFEVVWSSYPYGVNHYVASQVVRRCGIPWVADFRDLPDQAFENWKTRRAVKAETRVCAAAKVLTATCQPQVDKLSLRHAAPAYVIPNGFDPEDYSDAQVTASDKFTIGYFGILYTYRDPRPLFAALDLLESRGAIDPADVRVRFYVGAETGIIRDRLEGFRCGRLVECMPRVPVQEMCRLQQESVVLLNLKSPEAGGSVPSKLFDYMASRRPILNVPGDRDVVDAILEETRAGVTAGDPEAIARALETWYGEWKRTRWVACPGIPEKVARYSRQVQAKRLAEVLDSISGS